MSKLVRDKIPEIIKASGKTPIYTQCAPEELLGWLYSKLQEEYLELMNANERADILQEAADVFEVIRALLRANGYTVNDLILEADSKRVARGAFTKGYILERVEENE